MRSKLFTSPPCLLHLTWGLLHRGHSVSKRTTAWRWCQFCRLQDEVWGLLLFKTEKAMAPHSGTLAWKIPWTEEPGGLQSMGSLNLPIYFWLYWVFIAVWGVFLVAASGDYSPIVALGFSVLWLLFQSTVSIVVAHRLSCSIGCGIIQDQGSNQCLLHWQADSLPLSHQGSPFYYFLNLFKKKKKKNTVLKFTYHTHQFIYFEE